MTQMGVILGTAAYVSPEQAKGKPVDKRADTWVSGCVLYEMLTGTQAFRGASLRDAGRCVEIRTAMDGAAARDAHEASCEAKVKGFGRRVVQAAVWAKYRFISPHK